MHSKLCLVDNQLLLDHKLENFNVDEMDLWYFAFFLCSVETEEYHCLIFVFRLSWIWLLLILAKRQHFFNLKKWQEQQNRALQPDYLV